MTQADEILVFLRSLGSASIRDLYDVLDYPRASIRRAVYGLIDRGVVKRVERGIYEVVEEFYQVAVAMRFVEKGDYFFITCYFVTDDRAKFKLQECKRRIKEQWEEETGYSYSDNWLREDPLISDWEEFEDEDELKDWDDEDEGWYKVERES